MPTFRSRATIEARPITADMGDLKALAAWAGCVLQYVPGTDTWTIVGDKYSASVGQWLCKDGEGGFCVASDDAMRADWEQA